MTKNQDARFAQMTTELLVDLYELDDDARDAILNPVEDAEVEAPAYSVTVPSKSSETGTKTYDATHLSGDAGRNVALLNIALKDMFAATDDERRDAIRAFMQAIVASL